MLETMPRCFRKAIYSGGTSERGLPVWMPKSKRYCVGDAVEGVGARLLRDCGAGSVEGRGAGGLAGAEEGDGSVRDGGGRVCDGGGRVCDGGAGVCNGGGWTRGAVGTCPASYRRKASANLVILSAMNWSIRSNMR